MLSFRLALVLTLLVSLAESIRLEPVSANKWWGIDGIDLERFQAANSNKGMSSTNVDVHEFISTTKTLNIMDGDLAAKVFEIFDSDKSGELDAEEFGWANSAISFIAATFWDGSYTIVTHVLLFFLSWIIWPSITGVSSFANGIFNLLFFFLCAAVVIGVQCRMVFNASIISFTMPVAKSLDGIVDCAQTLIMSNVTNDDDFIKTLLGSLIYMTENDEEAECEDGTEKKSKAVTWSLGLFKDQAERLMKLSDLINRLCKVLLDQLDAMRVNVKWVNQHTKPSGAGYLVSLYRKGSLFEESLAKLCSSIKAFGQSEVFNNSSFGFAALRYRLYENLKLFPISYIVLLLLFPEGVAFWACYIFSLCMSVPAFLFSSNYVFPVLELIFTQSVLYAFRYAAYNTSLADHFLNWVDWSYMNVGEEQEQHLPKESMEKLRIIAWLGVAFFIIRHIIKVVWGSGESFEGMKKDLISQFGFFERCAYLAVIAAVLELVAPDLCNYPFIFDPLSYNELRRIILSPYCVVALVLSISSTKLYKSFEEVKKGATDATYGFFISANAGFWEEVAYRLLLQPIAMLAIHGIIFCSIPFDYVLSNVAKWPCPVLLYPLEILRNFLEFITFNKLTFLISRVDNYDMVYVYAILLCDTLFALDHSHQGPFGVLIKPFGTIYKRHFAISYGLVASIFAHFLWDAILFSLPFVWSCCYSLLCYLLGPSVNFINPGATVVLVGSNNSQELLQSDIRNRTYKVLSWTKYLYSVKIQSLDNTDNGDVILDDVAIESLILLKDFIGKTVVTYGLKKTKVWWLNNLVGEVVGLDNDSRKWQVKITSHGNLFGQVKLVEGRNLVVMGLMTYFEHLSWLANELLQFLKRSPSKYGLESSINQLEKELETLVNSITSTSEVKNE